jgi:hypothetical protein
VTQLIIEFSEGPPAGIAPPLRRLIGFAGMGQRFERAVAAREGPKWWRELAALAEIHSELIERCRRHRHPSMG